METMSPNVQQVSSYTHERKLVLTAFQSRIPCRMTNVSALKTAQANKSDALQIAHIKQAGDSNKNVHLQCVK